MIETVIFDLDGVIIDSEPIHFSVEKKLFQEFGIGITDKEHEEFVGTSSKDMWQKLKTITDIKYSFEELANISDEEYLKFISTIKDLEPIPGVRELIINLYNDNLQLIIASSSSETIINTVLRKFSLTQYFKIIVSGADLFH